VCLLAESEANACCRVAGMKVVVEPSGAVGLAAALSPQFMDGPFKQCNKVGIILCGGNLDLEVLFASLNMHGSQSGFCSARGLSWLCAKQLATSDRSCCTAGGA
jgi:threonine dehydratase